MNKDTTANYPIGTIVRVMDGEVYRVVEHVNDIVWRGILLNRSHEPSINRETGKPWIDTMHVRAIARVLDK